MAQEFKTVKLLDTDIEALILALSFKISHIRPDCEGIKKYHEQLVVKLKQTKDRR